MSETVAKAFSDELYASSFRRKLKRSLQLGWRYYVWDLPRYLAHRRAMSLSPFDLQAAINPLLEFWPLEARHPRPPDGYDEALRRLCDAGLRLTLPPARILALVSAWQQASALEGDVIECGSYRGCTGLLLALLGAIQGRRQKVILFDTFRGSPAGSRHDTLRPNPEYFLPPDYPDALWRQATAMGIGDRLEVHAGIFRETFADLAHEPLRFSFAHIDANLFESTSDACAFVVPRMVPAGLVVFDDYHGPCDLGARLAIDRYFHDRSERPCRLSGNSAWLRISERHRG